MSTRRARIKGVTALPPRRKNADTDKKKQETEVIKTPKTRRVSYDRTVNVSPKPVRSSPRKSPRQFSRTPDRYAASEPRVCTPIPVERDRSTPTIEKAAEKFNTDVFLSPLVRASPRRRSSIVRTPVVEVDVRTEKLITSQGVRDSNEMAEITKVCNRSTATPVPVDKESGNTTDEESQSVQSEVVDGIVPLQPVKGPPKPIDLLKNEIISDTAEVSFDPIIPLPSPSKVRPKLRPVPRLGPLRRNSIQGSASESEDESRRSQHGSATPIPMRQRYDSNITFPATNRDLHRVRNDSVCSSTGHSTSHTPTFNSPHKDKEKNAVTNRRKEVSRRLAAMRKRKETVQRDTLTMYDLIFYNPIANPIIPDETEMKAKEANKKEEEERKAIEKDKEVKKQEDKPKEEAAPVPQIKLGPNGEIVLDEQSLVIKQSQQRDISSVVCEGTWDNRTTMYRRTPRTAEWSDAETVRFYRAVAAIGTDFSLMQPLFPTRSRRDLKLKFKKEERMNAVQLDKALRAGAQWDVNKLEMEFNNERKLAEENAKKSKESLKKDLNASKERCETLKKLGIRKSRGIKALETSAMPDMTAKSNLPSTADDLLSCAQDFKSYINKKKRSKKPKSPKNPEHVDVSKTSEEVAKPHYEPAQRSDTPLLPVPTNIENGSLVVLAVDDPKSPSKKMFQTYISHEGGELTPVCLSSTFLNSVVGYMKKGGTSPQLSSNSPGTSERSTPVDLTPYRKKRKTSASVTQ